MRPSWNWRAVFSRTDHCGRIGNAPMRSHGSAGPNGAYFLCSVIANREYKIKMRCARLCKFIPALAAQPFGRQPRPLQYLDRLRPNLPCWMATCAVRGEIWRASMIQNGLGHNRARRITGTQKQNVVASLHFSVTPFTTPGDFIGKETINPNHEAERVTHRNEPKNTEWIEAKGDSSLLGRGNEDYLALDTLRSLEYPLNPRKLSKFCHLI